MGPENATPSAICTCLFKLFGVICLSALCSHAPHLEGRLDTFIFHVGKEPGKVSFDLSKVTCSWEGMSPPAQSHSVTLKYKNIFPSF